MNVIETAVTVAAMKSYNNPIDAYRGRMEANRKQAKAQTTKAKKKRK